MAAGNGHRIFYNTMRTSFLFLLLFLIQAAACSLTKAPETAPLTDFDRFPAADVCVYPKLSISKRMQVLGEGSWSPRLPDAADDTYTCSSVPLRSVLGSSENGQTAVEFSASGLKDGASVINVAYQADLSSPDPYETTYRTMYVAFADEMVQAALGKPAPELLKKKLANLESYSGFGKDAGENFDVGKGFITVNRYISEDKTRIAAEVLIFPDQKMKLK